MKSNVCAVCSASFYQKELHLNKMIKEAILYVNAIEDLVYEECGPDKEDADKQNDDSNHSFPDIDLTFNESLYSLSCFYISQWAVKNYKL